MNGPAVPKIQKGFLVLSSNLLDFVCIIWSKTAHGMSLTCLTGVFIKLYNFNHIIPPTFFFFCAMPHIFNCTLILEKSAFT
jgi:hypothetical protein